MKRRVTPGFIILYAVLFVFSSPALSKEKDRVITPGDLFPEFSFPMSLSKGEVEYLGLPTKFLGLMKGDSFSLKDVKAEVILVEYMNKYCFSCQLQAPVLNQVFEMVGNDPQLKGKVKFLAVAAGNNQTEVDSFRAEKKIPFPIIPDPKFLAYEAVGDPGATPFTLLVRKTDSGLVVTRARVGLKLQPEFFLKELNETLRADWNAILSQPKDSSLEQAKAKRLQIRYSEEELLKKAQESMRSPKWKVLGAAKVKLADGEEIYAGEIQSGNQKSYVFAKLASRAPTCDLCHASHFFFTFDEKGMIVNFLPIQLTKVDNVSWDSKEVEKMRQRLVGRSVLQPVDFDPQVDSVSSATMTAALVVDSVNKAKTLFEGLKGKGYIK
jgi:thiol-disulfide isomerase/thioredoxin